MKRSILFLFVILIFTACNSSKELNSDQLAKQKEIFERVQSGDFRIQAWQATPMRGRMIPLTSSYDLIIRNDSAIAHLPYFGRAYYAPMTNEGGIKFAEPVKEYRAHLNKKGDGYDISFDVKTFNQQYSIRLNVFQNGEAYMNFSSNQRDPINFNGNIMMEEK